VSLTIQKPNSKIPLVEIKNALPCNIVKRLNRFVVEIKDHNGKTARACINNTGRLEGYLEKGKTGFCIRNKPGMKTDYRLFSIKINEEFSTIIDTNMQMRAFEKTLELGVVPWLKNCRCVKRNVRLGKSVIDYLIKCDEKEIYLEVKSAVKRKNIFAMYPDAPSERGRKHIIELKNAIKKEKNAMVVFISSLPNVKAFKPSEEIDPMLNEILKTAYKNGLKINSLNIYYNQKDGKIYLENPDLEIILQG